MLVDAVSVLPDMNKLVPIQLTLLAVALTVTLIVEPGEAAVNWSGLNVTDPVTPELVNICST